MATIHITLPEPMKQWVEDRHDDASEYVRDLIRRDQERSSKISAMQRLVDEGRRSGISTDTPDDIRERAIRSVGNRM